MMDIDATDSVEKDNDSIKDTEQHSNASNASIGDLNELNDDSLADEMDVSDVSSSIAENENDSKTPSPRKKPKKRPPPIMIGYKKRRKVYARRHVDDSKTESEIGSPVHESIDEKLADEAKKLDQSSGSSDDNASETSSTKSTSRSVRKFSREDDIDLIMKIMSAGGRHEIVPEHLMHAMSAVSGSGIAFIFNVIEALSDGAVKQGVPRSLSYTAVAQTLLGAAQMILQTGEHPAILKDNVCSPGGTTICGIHALEEGGLRATLMNAIEASTQKSIEINKKK